MPRSISLTGRSLVAGAAQGALLFADVGLSFWGGVDSASGEVIDRHHPLSGEYLAGCVLAIPSGRGSCTGSSVLMELISNGHAPAALVLAEPDEILTLGVLVAQTIFERSLPVLCIGREAFAALRGQAFARVEGATLSLFDHLPGDAWQATRQTLPHDRRHAPRSNSPSMIRRCSTASTAKPRKWPCRSSCAWPSCKVRAAWWMSPRRTSMAASTPDRRACALPNNWCNGGRKCGCPPPSIRFPWTSAAGANWASTRPSANRPVPWAMPTWRWAHN